MISPFPQVHEDAQKFVEFSMADKSGDDTEEDEEAGKISVVCSP